jgi:hypothetical protein
MIGILFAVKFIRKIQLPVIQIYWKIEMFLCKFRSEIHIFGNNWIIRVIFDLIGSIKRSAKYKLTLRIFAGPIKNDFLVETVPNTYIHLFMLWFILLIFPKIDPR